MTHRDTPVLTPTPLGKLAARQVWRFLLGVHNLSQALIESRVIYNAAAPLPAWAAPPATALAKAQSPSALPSPEQSHTQAPLRKKGAFLLLPQVPFFILAFLQSQRLHSKRLYLNLSTPLLLSNLTLHSLDIWKPITVFLN